MDDKRFDSLAKLVGKGASRRSVIKGLLGLGSSAIAGAAVSREDADARRVTTRSRIPAPPPPTCPTGEQECGGSGSAFCCADGRCFDGVCCETEGTTGCGAGCCATNQCTSAGECCAAGQDVCGAICCPIGSCARSGNDDICCDGTLGNNAFPCGLDCCATEAQCCGGECCDADAVCLTKAFDGEGSPVEEEECCLIEEACDEQCCLGGTCFTPPGSSATGFDRECCPAEASFCEGTGAFGGIGACCQGETPDCCVRLGEPICIDRAAQCCVNADCDDDPANCLNGVCRREGQTCAFANQVNCDPGEVCCLGGDNVCCPEENDCCGVGAATVCCDVGFECCQRTVAGVLTFTCIDPNIQCCFRADCAGEPFNFDLDCINCRASDNTCVRRNQGLACNDSECGACDDGNCVDNDPFCTGDCDVCTNLVCVDDQGLCGLECDICYQGQCIDNQADCPRECEDCREGVCVDFNAQCSGCEICFNGQCIDSDDGCANCQDCYEGQCIERPAFCDDGVPCTDDTCDPLNINADNDGCVSTPNDAFCDDILDCTIDTCDPDDVNADPESGCLRITVNADCNDDVACTIDVCHPSQGCINTANDALCDDCEICDPIEDCVFFCDSDDCCDGCQECYEGDCIDDDSLCPLGCSTCYQGQCVFDCRDAFDAFDLSCCTDTRDCLVPLGCDAGDGTCIYSRNSALCDVTGPDECLFPECNENGTCTYTRENSLCRETGVCAEGSCSAAGVCSYTDENENCSGCEVCYQGQCVDDCPAGSTCNTGTGECEPVLCGGIECGDEDVCCSGVCCAGGCDNSNLCCETGFICNGVCCRVACAITGPDTGECLSLACTSDGDCGFNESCCDNACVTTGTCHDDCDPACTEPDVCCSDVCCDGVCDISGLCCETGFICNEGVCCRVDCDNLGDCQSPACTSDAQCGFEEVCCDNVCCATACDNNGVCPPCQPLTVCPLDVCDPVHPDGCGGDFDCSSNCQAGVGACAAITDPNLCTCVGVTCQPPACSCGPNEFCGEEGNCVCLDNASLVVAIGCLLDAGQFCSGDADCAGGRCIGNTCLACADTSHCSITFGPGFTCTSGVCGKDIPCEGAACCVEPDQICSSDGVCCSGACDVNGNCCPLPNEVCTTDGVCCSFGCDINENCLPADPCAGVTCGDCEVCVAGGCQVADPCCLQCGTGATCGEEGDCICLSGYVMVVPLGCRLAAGQSCTSDAQCGGGRCTGGVACQDCVDHTDCSAAFGAGFNCFSGVCAQDTP